MRGLILAKVLRRDGTAIVVGTGDRALEPEELAELELATTAQRQEALAGQQGRAAIRLRTRSVESLCLPLMDTNHVVVDVLWLIYGVDDPRIEAALSRRLQFEKLIAQLSTRFIDLAGQGADSAANDALAAIGEFAQVDRAYAFLYSKDGRTMSNTHEWCSEGVSSEMFRLQELPMEAFPWSIERLKRQQVVHVPRVRDLSGAATPEREMLLAQSIQSLVLVPLVYERKPVGFMGFDSVRTEKIWPQEDVALLRIVGEMFMGALERERAERERRELEKQLVLARSLENVAQLAGGVAHDFNNLLAVILNCATIVRNGTVDPTLKRHTEELVSAVDAAAGLTRQLLVVGRRGVTKPVELDPDGILRTLEPLLRRTLGERVELALRLGAEGANVRLGQQQFEQIVVNLVMNARDAIPASGRVVIETAVVDAGQVAVANSLDPSPGPYVMLSVEDTGQGMPPEVLESAFEPFFTTKRPTGTGLGLSTVHSIVKQFGGQVSLASAEGLGTTLRVYFPLVEPNKAKADDTPRKEPPRSTEGGAQCVLVVEDCATLRRQMCDTLSTNGYSVCEAGSPSQALRACDGLTHLDLLLTDVILPEMSGRQLGDRILERFPQARVAYVSGYEDDVLAQQGVLDDGIRLLPKPFRLESLLEFVRAALEPDLIDLASGR